MAGLLNPNVGIYYVIARRPEADVAISNRSSDGDCHGPKGPRNDAYSLNLDRLTLEN